MFKRTLGLIAATVFASGTMANTTTPTDIELAAANGIECYPLAHGENGLGSRNEVYIPPFSTEVNWWVDFAISNVSGSSVNVIFKLFDENGSQYDSTTGVFYDGKFSSTNSPIRQIGGTNSALLSSFEIGRMKIDSNAPTYFTGVVSWQTDKCLTKPPLLVDASFNLVSQDAQSYAMRTIDVNGGKPF